MPKVTSKMNVKNQTKMKNKFWNFIVNEASEDTPESIELRIEGNIVSDNDAWIYEWFGETCSSPNNFRSELAEHKGKDITVWIDSYGGDVFAGAGIYNALKEHDGKITIKIDGKAMSAASVIAMAGDEISMSPVAVMMIHNPLTYASGDMREMRKTADILDTVKETIVNAYVNKTNKSREEISNMMDDETWMSASIAVKNGFADNVLYNDEIIEVDNIKDFSFNRGVIVNSTNEAIKHLCALENDNKQNLNNKLKNNINIKNKVKEGKVMTKEEFKNQYPELYKEIVDEGAINERKRIKSIEDLAMPGNEDLVNKAKFEEIMTVENLAVEIIKNEKNKGKNYLNNRNEDVEKSNIENVASTKDTTINNTLEDEKEIVQDMADLINSNRRRI